MFSVSMETKGLAAPGGDHFGAEFAQDLRQDIAAHRRMLIHKNAQTGETAGGETGQIATDVGLFGGSDRAGGRSGARLSIPEASKADVVAVRLYSSTRTRSTSRA